MYVFVCVCVWGGGLPFSSIHYSLDCAPTSSSFWLTLSKTILGSKNLDVAKKYLEAMKSRLSTYEEDVLSRSLLPPLNSKQLSSLLLVDISMTHHHVTSSPRGSCSSDWSIPRNGRRIHWHKRRPLL